MQSLHLAAYHGDVEAAGRLLADGLPLDERDDRGFTPLPLACFRAGAGNYVPVVNLLVGAGADVEAATPGKGGSNCLMFAAQSGSEATVNALLVLGAAVNAPVDGVTALMIAAGQGDEKIVQLLLTAGADPAIQSATDAASDYAAHYGHDDLASELLHRVNKTRIS